MKKIDYTDQQGICANCGSSEIEYERDFLDDEEYIFTYTCRECKKEGRESYWLEFSTNTIDEE